MLIYPRDYRTSIQEINTHYIFIPREISVLIVIKNMKKCIKKTASRDLRLTVFHSSIYIIFLMRANSFLSADWNLFLFIEIRIIY